MFLVGATFFAGSGPAHVQDRIDIWTNTFESNPCDLTERQLEAGEDCGVGQIRQSLYTQSEGGLFGEGLGESLLKLPGPFFPESCEEGFPFCGSILPEPHTDFIFAVIVAELGLFGACGLIALYALIGARAFKTAVMAKDGFSKLLATGLGAIFCLQAFVIIGGVTKVIPLTGVTLPFVSYGGSSIVANMILLALLLLVSHEARRPEGSRA
jgi:cell division protein FtsW (lipid II flippase)